jgi:tungstate transport system substrate-binding protein
LLWAAWIATFSAGCGREVGPGDLVLATTTSVANSGVLDRLLPLYEQDSGRIVRVLQVGSGQALKLFAEGRADAAISHAPSAESRELHNHPGWWYRKIMYNDFVIVGPPADPAGASAASDAVDAMRTIARGNDRFLSRGDSSGTHERERQLWDAAGISPPPGRLIVTGTGMAQTLRVADANGAYTLADRGTYLALAASISLRVLHEGDSRLLNTYAVLADRSNVDGLSFAKWLAEGAGRAHLETFVRDRVIVGFTPWPEGVDGSRPDARPW